MSTVSLNDIPSVKTADRAKGRVLYLTMGAGIGGGSISLLTLMEELQIHNVACAVALPENGPLVERYERIGVPCYEMKFDWLNRRHPVSTFTGYRAWSKLLRETAPDIIHVNALPAARPIAIAARLAGIPWVCHCRFPPEPAYVSWLLRGLPKPCAVLFNSNGLKRESGSCLASMWPNSSQFVVHNSVNIEQFHCAERIAHRPPRVGIVANLTPVKAHEVFIAMAAQLTSEGVNAEYWLVGRDKGCETKLRALVASHDLESKIKFLGYREDVPSVLAELDVLVCCSHQETFGRCAVEGMAARLPVVATRVGGLPEVIDDGVTGILVPPRDPSALAAAVKRLLDDSSLCSEMGTAGRERAILMFGSSSHAKEILKIYSKFVTTASFAADGSKMGSPSSNGDDADSASENHA